MAEEAARLALSDAASIRPAAPRAEYRTAPGVTLKDWSEDVAVAYDTATAKTHLISAEAVGVLQLVSAAGATFTELRLAAFDASDSASAGAETTLTTLLEGLCRSGLLQLHECQPS